MVGVLKVRSLLSSGVAAGNMHLRVMNPLVNDRLIGRPSLCLSERAERAYELLRCQFVQF